MFFAMQRRGWEPAAVLNWLALAGWGAQTEASDIASPSSGALKQPPDSTTLMTMGEMIQEVVHGFCISRS